VSLSELRMNEQEAKQCGYVHQRAYLSARGSPFSFICLCEMFSVTTAALEAVSSASVPAGGRSGHFRQCLSYLST
jgi:hypothetical protein